MRRHSIKINIIFVFHYLQVDQDEVALDRYGEKLKDAVALDRYGEKLKDAVASEDYPPSICYSVRYKALPFPPPDFEQPSSEKLTVSLTGTHKPVVSFPITVYTARGEYICCIEASMYDHLLHAMQNIHIICFILILCPIRGLGIHFVPGIFV